MHSLINESIMLDGGPVRIKGYSMFPRFLSGCTVEVESVKIGDLKIGDIVLVQLTGRHQIHRLIRPIQDQMFQTAGDFTRGAEVPLAVCHLRGRVPKPTRFFERIVEWLMCNITLWRYS